MEDIIIDKLHPDDALVILKRLANEHADIALRIEQIALEHLREVDIEDIADQVYFDLDNIPVDEIWDRSGSTREGYVDPYDLAWEMFEQALAPFMDELRKYQELSLATEARSYCMGILKGIYRFEKESTSEYKDWAEDAPHESFKTVLADWKKACNNQKDVDKMKAFIEENCPGW